MHVSKLACAFSESELWFQTIHRPHDLAQHLLLQLLLMLLVLILLVSIILFSFSLTNLRSIIVLVITYGLEAG